MTYTLRPAMQADFPAIRALIRTVQINPTGLHWRRFIVATTPNDRIPSDTGNQQVANNRPDRVIGCGQIKLHRDGSHELASIAVVPEWQRRGVASAIIERLLEMHRAGSAGEQVEASRSATAGQSQALKPLYLTCRLSLGPFYERFGFRSIEPDEMPPYFRRISRLAKLAGFIMKEELLVMKSET